MVGAAIVKSPWPFWLEKYVAPEVHVRRFKSKEGGIKRLQEEAVVLPCADGSLRHEGPHNIRLYANAGRVHSTLGETS